MKRRYGWRPDLPDFRDYDVNQLLAIPSILPPPKIDLRPNVPPIRDQGKEGSCVGHGIRGVAEYLEYKDKLPKVVELSPAFAYFVARSIEGTTDSDSGASIRDGVKGLVKWGIATEKEFPYKVGGFKKQPTLAVFKDALTRKATAYYRVTGTGTGRLFNVKLALSSFLPVVFGFSVYDSFESDAVAKTGIVPMPKHTESLQGGHCVAIFGYDDLHQWVICANSWGTRWGDAGFFYLPYAYVTTSKLSSDYWVVTKEAGV